MVIAGFQQGVDVMDSIVIDAPGAVILNLSILGIVWWIITKFREDYRKDQVNPKS
jgi:hypothetical protein